MRKRFAGFAGVKVTIEPTGMEVEDPAVHMLRNHDQRPARDALSLEPSAIATGRNGGYQAVNIAALAGARRNVLLAYDMQFREGRSHWFGHHEVKNAPSEFAQYARNFRALVEPLKTLGVEVINATPDSALDAFPRMTLEEALA